MMWLVVVAPRGDGTLALHEVKKTQLVTFASLTSEFWPSGICQVLYLSPPLEHARAAWIHQFHAFLHTAAGLPRLRSKVFAVLGGGEGDGNRSNYQMVVNALPRDSLRKAYQEIEARLAEVCGLASMFTCLTPVKFLDLMPLDTSVANPGTCFLFRR